MTVYIIKSTLNNYILLSYLSGLPNYVAASSLFEENTIQAEFNHTTTAERVIFLQNLTSRTTGSIIIDNDYENPINLTKYIDELRLDVLLFSMTPRLQITNLPTTYTDIFPSLYQGFPIPIHTIGYTKMGFVLLWNKNGGVSQHDLRLVKCDNSGNLLPNNITPDILVEGLNIPSGRTTNFDFVIPSTFLNGFRGFVKIQGKSGNGTDDPILDALFVYLVR